MYKQNLCPIAVCQHDLVYIQKINIVDICITILCPLRYDYRSSLYGNYSARNLNVIDS